MRLRMRVIPAMLLAAWFAATFAPWILNPPPAISWERWAATLVGTDPLHLELVCGWETRGERARSYHTAAHARGDGGQARGICQVQIETAAKILGITNLTPERRRILGFLLERPAVNAILAASELKGCHRRTIERTTYCYNAGPAAHFHGPTEYTKNVGSRYAAAKFKQRTL